MPLLSNASNEAYKNGGNMQNPEFEKKFIMASQEEVTRIHQHSFCYEFILNIINGLFKFF